MPCSTAVALPGGKKRVIVAVDHSTVMETCSLYLLTKTSAGYGRHVEVQVLCHLHQYGRHSSCTVEIFCEELAVWLAVDDDGHPPAYTVYVVKAELEIRL